MADRHRRQQLLPWLGAEGQARLARSTVLITRVGGLGGPLTQSLAMAGVGRVVFYHEGDLIEEDLHRMILMDPGGVGLPRAPQAEAALRRLGHDGFRVLGHRTRLTRADADDWMAQADLALGAAPTFEERFLLNDAAVAAGKPFIDAAMYGDEAHVLCVLPGRSACLRCLVPEPPPWHDDFPVLAAVSATVGNLAAGFAVRTLVGAPGVPWGELVHLDLERVRLDRIALTRRPGCPACALAPAS